MWVKVSILRGFVMIVPNFCEADLTVLDDSMYTCPVLLWGSTIVKCLVATLLCVQAVGKLIALEDAVMLNLAWLSSGVRQVHKLTSIYSQSCK